MADQKIPQGHPYQHQPRNQMEIMQFKEVIYPKGIPGVIEQSPQEIVENKKA
jgi:hypothetical protein